MKKSTVVSLIRIALALLTFTAIITQLCSTLELGRSVSNFFSFFTIESNIIAGTLFAIVGIGGILGAKRGQLDYLRGAATLYMTMTGIIYVLLLSGNEVSLQTTIPWVNMVLHYVMPVAVLIDWLIRPPVKRITYRSALYWMIFPVAYFIYSLIRGAIIGWYPYPFINPALNGWPTMILTCIIILIGVFALVKVLVICRGRMQ